jgi:hypothetical protein
MSAPIGDDLFPLWEDDCGPDRFLPRPVDFPPAAADPEHPGEVKTMAVYTNRRGQQFPLTGFASERDRELLDDFCAALRVWMEAVPATAELKRALDELDDPPDDAPSEPEDAATITLEMHEASGVPLPAVVFALFDPDLDSVANNGRHVYRRPSPGPACLHVKSGRAILRGVQGGPFTVSGGHDSPSRPAGRQCSVHGDPSATYWLAAVWEQIS